VEKLQSIAKKIDILFKILQILLKVALITLLVGAVIVIAGLLFRLDPDMLGTGYDQLDLGFLSLHLASGFAPEKRQVLLQTAVEILMALACVVIAMQFAACIRKILCPMQEGQPFHAAISHQLRRCAWLYLALGIVMNVAKLASQALTVSGYHLETVLLSEKVTHVSFLFQADLSFLVVWGMLLLLSCIFRYGQQLQQLSDETL